MSRIDDLIRQYCPDGVPMVKLGEVCETVTPPGKLQTKQYHSVGKYPVIDQGQSLIVAYTDDENVLLPQDEYVLYGDHTCIVKYWNGVFAQGADGLKILHTDECCKYIYYALRQYNLTNTEYKRHWTQAKEIFIPLPPLPVQEEIVRELDAMTDLLDNLDQEITARKKEYEHYREQLLTFGDDVERKKLGDICTHICSGKFSKKAENGLYPVYGSTGIIAFSNEYIYNEEKILIARVGANAGYVHVAKGKYDVTDNTLIVNLKDGVNLMFIYYSLRNRGLNQYAKGGGQPLVTGKDIKELVFPLPPLPVQQAIVKQLDAFEALIQNLEAERQLRQKQYEYYREKLLTF